MAYAIRPRVTPQHTTLDSTQSRHKNTREFGLGFKPPHAWAVAMSMLSIIMTAMP
jgi:hypothetical protein